MLHLVFHGKESGQETVMNWHTGTKLNPFPIYECVEVQADGDELAHIIAKFVNLSYYKSPVVSWYGDHAKQIAKYLHSYHVKVTY